MPGAGVHSDIGGGRGGLGRLPTCRAPHAPDQAGRNVHSVGTQFAGSWSALNQVILIPNAPHTARGMQYRQRTERLLKRR